jgi:hypothetical protein
MLFIILDIFGATLIKGALKTPAGLASKLMEITGEKTGIKALQSLAEKIKEMFIKVGDVGVLKEWFDAQSKEFNKFIDLISGESSLSIPKNIVSKSIIGGAKTYGILKGFEYLMSQLSSSDNTISPITFYSSFPAEIMFFALTRKKISFKDEEGVCYFKKGSKYYYDLSCQSDKESLTEITDTEMLEGLWKVLLNYLTLNPKEVNFTSYRVFQDTEGKYSTHINSYIVEINGSPLIITCPTQESVDTTFGKTYCKPYFLDNGKFLITRRFNVSPTKILEGSEK